MPQRIWLHELAIVAKQSCCKCTTRTIEVAYSARHWSYVVMQVVS